MLEGKLPRSAAPAAIPANEGAAESKTNLKQLMAGDLPASLVVFVVALPLSLGIALASGAPLMGGLIAAIIGGIVVGLLGGAPLQVSGPAAGLTVIVAGYIQQFGWGVTCAITLAAGLLQLALGAAGVAPLAMGISPAVIHGMLAAIGILIAMSQAHVVMGHEPAGKGFKAILKLPETASHANMEAVIIGVLVIAIMLFWTRMPLPRLKAIPQALAAVLIGTVVSLVFGMNVPRVELGGSLFSSLHLPEMPKGDMGAVVGAVLGLCFVASAESLLCAVATDKLHTGPRANLNKELMAQGAGNALSGLIGGLPITGVVVRSTANIGAGAKTRISAILHGVWMLVFVSAFPALLTRIPLAALAGLLVYTGFKLVNLHHVQELRHRGELGIYLITVAAIVGTNLLMGLAIGFGVAVLMLLWRLTHVHVDVIQDHGRWDVDLHGALTFAGVPKLTTRLQSIPAGAEVRVDLALNFIDHAGYEALHSWQKQHEAAGGTVEMEGLDEMWAFSRHRERREAKRKVVEINA